MNITLWLNKDIKENYIKESMNEYIKRLQRFSKITIKKGIPKGPADIAFLWDGEDISSENLSVFLQEEMLKKSSLNVIFSSGSSLKKIRLVSLPLKDLEYTLALEQIYRAFKIMNKETYHK